MESQCNSGIEVPEEIWVEIAARLPFRSITRFKAVSKRWRYVIESTYFRRLFMLAHQNSSSSWSIMSGTYSQSIQEVVGFYDCERYGLPHSLDSYIPPPPKGGKNMIMACTDGLVLLRTIISDEETHHVGTLSVGKPVFNQWVQLPRYPFDPVFTKATGLVTRVDEDGIVLDYKVVCIFSDLYMVEDIRFDIYSSQTGSWTRKQADCSCLVFYLSDERCLCLNKMLHWLDNRYDSHGNFVGGVVAYDFYADDEEQQCRVIPFPEQKACFATYTTSGGFLVYINVTHLVLRLWRLQEYTSDSGRWQFMQEINAPSSKYLPMAMHPFETHILYMVTGGNLLVSIDLKTHKVSFDTKPSTYDETRCVRYLDNVDYNVGYRYISDYRPRNDIFYTPQYILPRWMGSVPRSPQISPTI